MDQSADLAYYSTAATVLPVLYGLILFELRAFGNYWRTWLQEPNPDRSAYPWQAALVAFLVGLLFLLGEMNALQALSDGEVKSSWATDTALQVMVTMIFIVPMQAYADVVLHRIPLLRRMFDRMQVRHDAYLAQKANATAETVKAEREEESGSGSGPDS